MDPKYRDIGHPIDQLIEECSEVIHILCKVRRFGWDNYHPDDPKKTLNYELVENELYDLDTRINEFRSWMTRHEPIIQQAPRYPWHPTESDFSKGE
jgi:hypothetical protein